MIYKETKGKRKIWLGLACPHHLIFPLSPKKETSLTHTPTQKYTQTDRHTISHTKTCTPTHTYIHAQINK